METSWQTSPNTTLSETVSVPESYTGNARYQALSTELRSLLVAANDNDNELDIHPQQNDHAANTPSLSQLVTRAELQDYMRTWLTECAPWLDMFDRQRTFALHVPGLAQRSPAVLYAMLALSARQQQRTQATTTSSPASIELYSHAIAVLSSTFDARQPSTHVTACILCVLEMMSASPQDWRRHLDGCAALFAAADIHGRSGGVGQAVFWCYARMDLCSAIISEGGSSTVLPVHKWLPREDHSEGNGPTGWHELAGRQDATPDMYANFAVYLTAQVCDLLARRSSGIESDSPNAMSSDDFATEWKFLWEALQSWHRERPTEMLPIKTATAAQLFPCAFYAHYAAISANQLYHTSCILMLEMRSQVGEDIPAPKAGRGELWHARCVVGISLVSTHRGCLNNAIQPLFVAGRYFSHRDEHAVIVDLLRRIEDGSGWAAKWRIPDLELIWGYPTGTFSDEQG